MALCKLCTKAELHLENFSLDNREIVELRQWRNWRKQKIRRAVNKSTQKLILLVPVGALGCCTVLSAGKPDDDTRTTSGKWESQTTPLYYDYYRLPLKLKQIQTATPKT